MQKGLMKPCYRGKKRLALLAAFCVGMNTMGITAVGVQAAETAENTYVVMTEGDQPIYDVLEEEVADINKDAIVQDNVAIVELTKKEADKLEKLDGVLYVEEDILLDGSDYKEGEDIFLDQPYVDAADQWNIDAVNANEQQYNQADGTVKVAVLDTGVDVSEDIDIAGRINLVPGEEEVSPIYEDVSGHGTAVASVIAAKENDIGVTGINPNVELYSVKALDDKKQAPLSRIIEGIYWCMENDIDIINMSFGTPVHSEIFQQVISDAYSQGILLIAAAGNRGNTSGDNIEFPAAFAEVIAVGATDTQGEFSEMSSAGAGLELLAPGERIPAIGFLDYIVCTEGTSMSAPHVTGAASVLWAKDTSKTNTFIRTLLNVSANHISDNGSSGIVDLDYALSVYDEFAEGYAEDAPMPDIKENPGDVKSYDDAVVEACWGQGSHDSMLNNDPSVSQKVLNIIKIGATLPDKKLEYHPEYDLYENNHSFHGGRNYIANYIFMRRIARKCYDEGWSVALKFCEDNIATKYSDHFTQSGFRQIYNGLNSLKWSEILTESGTNTKQNQARVLVGMAVHLATDAYAHKSWGISNGTVYQIPSWLDNRDPRDDPKYIPQRFKVAKQTARDIVKVWHEATGPSAKEFYHPNVYGDITFKMLHYASNLKLADLNYYTTHAEWFEKRTVETK